MVITFFLLLVVMRFLAYRRVRKSIDGVHGTMQEDDEKDANGTHENLIPLD